MFSSAPFSRMSSRLLAGVIAFQLSFPLPVHAAVVSLAQTPLAKSSSVNVLPNLMFILDDSGSMGEDHLPDYVNESGTCKGNFQSAVLTISEAKDAVVSALAIVPGGNCTVSVPNLMSSATSVQTTATGLATAIQGRDIAGDGWTISRSSSRLTITTTNFTPDQLEGCRVQMTLSSGTASPVAAGFGRRTCTRGEPPYQSPDFNRLYYNPDVLYVPGVNADLSLKPSQTVITSVKDDGYNTASANVNLTTGIRELVWCDTQTPSASDIANATSTSDNCRVSTNDYDYPNGFYRFAANASGTTFFERFVQPYYFRVNVLAHCSDAKLTSCVQSATPTGAFDKPARVRFCKVGNTSDCQEKQNPLTGYVEPNYLNLAIPKAAFGRIDITSVGEGMSISTIPINGVDAIAGNSIFATAGETTTSFASKVANAINAALTTPEYRACIGSQDGNNGCSGTPDNRVTIYPQLALGSTQVLTGTTANGRTVAVTGPAPLSISAKWTLTLGSGRTPVRVSGITIGGTAVMSGGPFDAPNGLDTSLKRQTLALSIKNAVTLAGYTATLDPSNEKVIITAPAGSGSSENGKSVVITGSRSASSTITLGSSGNNTSVSFGLRESASSGLNIVNPTSAPTGTNDAGEAATLASAMVSNVANGYSAASSGNVLTLYSPLGSNPTAAPVAFQSPSSSAAFTFTNIGSSSWRIDYVRIGGACAYTDNSGSGVLTAATAGSGTLDGIASNVLARDDAADTIVLSTPSTTSIRLTGVGAQADADLNGCTVSVQGSRTSGGSGRLTIGATQSSTTPFVFSNVATFAGGVAGMASIASSAPAMSGGYVGTAMSPSDVSSALTTTGVSQGPPTVTLANFANGFDAPRTFLRCDIKPDQRCVDSSGQFVGNNGTVAGGLFPAAGERTDCSSTTIFDPVANKNVRVCTYAEEKTNFANWYAYYRTRMLSMKTAAGTAFSSLGNNFRVGFVTINKTINVGTGEFLKLGEFSGAHRSDWYDKLYGTVDGNNTPLRHALSKVGRYYAGEAIFSGAPDPMQYSCQNNYTLLTTDGYWNEDWDDAGIVKANGDPMDDADSGASVPRPFNDGGLGGTCGVGRQQGGQFSSCGTLADVAYHFYETDLRPAGGPHCLGDTVGTVQHDVCTNNSGNDNQQPQRMTTYTLGLGVDGTLEFQDNYADLVDGTDFKKIKDGVLNWPQVANLHPTAVDDLWHAAVNGRGQYFSAGNPQSLSRSLRTALSLIAAEIGAGAAAATSNLEPTAEDNFAFVASYQTQTWKGNLEARRIDRGTGQVSATADWCVENVVDAGTNSVLCNGTLKNKVAAASDTRTIYLRKAGALNASGVTVNLAPFLYSEMSATQQSYFNPTLLAQYATLSLTAKAAATPESLVNYLRGQTGLEDQDGNANRAYRDRSTTMGDPVGSQPVFVGAPRFGYADAGYAGYKTAQASRPATVYIGTNGGMLHAFASSNGQERWAYVPSAVMPNMWELADFNYADFHRYFVDGAPIAADVCTANCTNSATAVWKSVVVGGYNAGGKGYYALDVTDPANPKSLWELADVDMGYSFGNPIITKRRNSDGTRTWVALLTSGYNNISTGHGYLYVVDIATGTILSKIDTGAGTPTTPSGLAKIESFIEDRDTDNVTTHVFGGDLLGNVWRFNIDQGATGAAKIAVLKDSTGAGQPITTRPLVTKLDDVGQTRYVIVGTGKLLETSDMTDAQVQSLYGFVDRFDDTAATIGVCAGCTKGAREQLTQATLVPVPDTNTRVPGPSTEPSSTLKVDGCMVDFPLTREKMNIDPKLVRGIVSAVTNVPGGDACVDGGVSYISFFDYKTCQAQASYKIRGAMGAGQIVIKTTGGFVTLVTVSDSPTPVVAGNVPPASGTSRSFEGRRVGWRVLFD